MKSADRLSEYVRLSLVGGEQPATIGAALAKAGWSQPEIAEALDAWHPAQPPVPRPQRYASAHEALVYGLLFLSLGAVAWHLCQLGMGLIDYLIPDTGEYGTAPGSSERWSIAALIAFTPVFMVLSRRVARKGPEDARGGRSLVRKWFAAITLLGASVVFLGDAIYVIYAFLSGDLTVRFFCKALLVAVVAAVVLGYYRDEMND